MHFCPSVGFRVARVLSTRKWKRWRALSAKDCWANSHVQFKLEPASLGHAAGICTGEGVVSSPDKGAASAEECQVLGCLLSFLKPRINSQWDIGSAWSASSMVRDSFSEAAWHAKQRLRRMRLMNHSILVPVLWRHYCEDQWEFQEPKLEVPTIYKAYIRPM